jgi:hypothetical protein
MLMKSRFIDIGDFIVLKAFMFHDVAPVTGRIPGADNDQAVLRFCLGQRRIVPGLPVHGIFRVLEQVRACFF